jgi:hypothetical protein
MGHMDNNIELRIVTILGNRTHAKGFTGRSSNFDFNPNLQIKKNQPLWIKI